MQTSGDQRREKAKLYPRHCERSEAIHLSTCGAMDCFAALANDAPEIRTDQISYCNAAKPSTQPLLTGNGNSVGLSVLVQLACKLRNGVNVPAK